MRKIERERILAYRLHGQGLTEPARPADLAEVAGRCYPQNTPPGSAGLALSARVPGATRETITELLEESRTLLQAFGARGAPHVFPVRDGAVFTRGLLPRDEESLREFLRGAVPSLDELGLPATDLAEHACEAVADVLDGTALTKDELGARAGERITGRLPAGLRDGWKGPSPYSAKQFLGESLVRFALPVASLRGVLCHGGRKGRSPLLRRTDQWTGPIREGPIREGPESAAAELVRRYLRCFGPSTPGHYAAWGGIAAAQADGAWQAVREELAELDGGWVLNDELALLESPPEPHGVRMLPPHDPYLQARDRRTLLPDRAWHQRVWRTVGNPGVILVDGEIRALWRPEARSGRLGLTLEPLRAIGRAHRAPIEEEAARVARHRGLAPGAISGW
ncbi:winged helix DNA-binding domain-containing protein [Nonomuraea sp. NPDC050643]|uniref:winged helix DNA-binding domain-containing protein n=1 Tax=Nonomuraea sp. NPDC050643 TaxID=3155660 RepID=UPI0033E8ACB2